MNIKEKQLLIRERKLLAVDNIKSFLEKIKKEDKSINSFIYVAEKEALEQAKNC